MEYWIIIIELFHDYSIIITMSFVAWILPCRNAHSWLITWWYSQKKHPKNDDQMMKSSKKSMKILWLVKFYHAVPILQWFHGISSISPAPTGRSSLSSPKKRGMRPRWRRPRRLKMVPPVTLNFSNMVTGIGGDRIFGESLEFSRV